MSEHLEEPGSVDDGPVVPGPPVTPPAAARYGAAVQQLFDSDGIVRDALRERLVDGTTQGLELRAEAASVFSGFFPSRLPAVDRAGATYYGPGDHLIELQSDQRNAFLEQQRAAPAAGRLRLHLTPGLLELIDTADANDERVGRIALADLLARARGDVPLPPADPVAAAHAEDRADDLLRQIKAPPAPAKSAVGSERASGSPQPAPPDADPHAVPPHADPPHTDSPAPKPEDLAQVLAKIKELLAEMRTPETAPVYQVPSRADQGTVREGLATFELRSGPADVTSYHDFSSLRIAFQGVWTEVFDGRLMAAGMKLYEEAVKLKAFAGLGSEAQSIDTLDDLKRLMEEVRDLSQITVDATPGEVRPQTGSTTVSQSTSAVDFAKDVLLGGPTGDSVVDAILNPGGALVSALGTLFAGKQHLTWESFPGPMPVGGDIISVRFEPDTVPAGTVEFVIENSPQAWWWKGLEFQEFDGHGHVISDFRISNDPRDDGVWQKSSYNRLPLYTPQLQNGALEFQKAAPGLGFGIHTGYYVLAGLPARMPDRMRAIFRWEKDS